LFDQLDQMLRFHHYVAERRDVVSHHTIDTEIKQAVHFGGFIDCPDVDSNASAPGVTNEAFVDNSERAGISWNLGHTQLSPRQAANESKRRNFCWGHCSKQPGAEARSQRAQPSKAE
jgi:hypothetical protein